MNKEEAIKQMISSLKLEGFTFDREARAMWDRVAAGEITTQDVRQMVIKKLQKEKPELFTQPDR